MNKHTLLAAALTASLAGTLSAPLAWAETMGVTHHGNFTHMVHTGETAGRVPLSELDTSAGRWGVGALAGLKGELIQVDGKLLVSLGTDPKGSAQAPRPGDSALLWVGAKVDHWVGTTLPTDMDQAQFEAFIQAQANAQQRDLAQPFVYRVSGEYAHLIWHVVTGEKPAAGATGGHGHGHGHGHGKPGGHGGGHANPASGMNVFRNPQAHGHLVGVYSGVKLEGTVTHPGERFHVHYIDTDLAVSGHVDQYGVRAGATLWLPKH